ncbi:MAG: hypothetical protein COS89_07125 [Deltaproteobacteria bacterium CG07_land_8_20_14_0_80_38_7]|nr:MAG: hypothetical protein COS89_07125 [Deltaproteobacteria bacterium CG07_land_8_20_14_0_80_38_7]
MKHYSITKCFLIIICFISLVGLLNSCHGESGLYVGNDSAIQNTETGNSTGNGQTTGQGEQTAATDPSRLIQPEDLVYIGAFRVPNGGTAPATWAWGGRALTLYPSGDASGAADGFSGSLYGAGHDAYNYITDYIL